MSTAPQQQEVLRSSSSTTSTETFVSADAFASADGLANVYTGVPLLWRMLEIVVSLFALVFFAPVMLIIALVIKRDTPGPALFFQQRVGQGMKPFKFVKFRTLCADARQRYPELYAYDYRDDELRDLKFKVEHDPRVTRQGRWLRRSSLDGAAAGDSRDAALLYRGDAPEIFGSARNHRVGTDLRTGAPEVPGRCPP